MNLRLTFTIIITKLLIFILRVLKHGGTSLPGKVAHKIYPDIIKVISKDFKIIMVTGTNGKTTTTRIIGKILENNGVTYITNKSGANLVSGVITTFINSVDITGKSQASTALLEVDEAAFNVVTDYVQPDILVVTNFFRDQLDRFGEIYSTLNNVRSGIEKSPNAKLVLNADDSLCVSLAHNSKREVVYYGFAQGACNSSENVENSDAVYCLYCKNRYEYSYKVYGHLGAFSCPNCSYSRPSSQLTCLKVDDLNSSYSDIVFSLDSANDDNERVSFKARINLPGLYNIYNALAAASLGHLLGFSVNSIIKAMESFECCFGRMETLMTHGKTIKIILVKNPTGFNQVLTYLLTEKQKAQIAFIINDKPGDGTDISWLWDVDFEKLEKIQENISVFYASGIRGEDMAVRLKYAGIYSDKITLIKDYEELLNKALEDAQEGKILYILPTYTAMLDIRKLLNKKYGLKEFWK